VGSLHYDRLDIDFDDRTLRHLQTVIVQKLRQNESFLFSWREDDGDGYRAVWLHPAIPLSFRYSDSLTPAMNREWISELTRSANSTQGLIALSERPATFPAAQPAPRP
jgi:hypothetical protein